MKKPIFWVCLLGSILGGAFAWWVDSRNDEPQAAVLVILLVTFILGFLLPRRAWLWATIMGSSITVGYLIARTVGHFPVNPVEPGWYAAFIALIPAFIGAYAGALSTVVIRALSAQA